MGVTPRNVGIGLQPVSVTIRTWALLDQRPIWSTQNISCISQNKRPASCCPRRDLAFWGSLKSRGCISPSQLLICDGLFCRLIACWIKKYFLFFCFFSISFVSQHSILVLVLCAREKDHPSIHSLYPLHNFVRCHCRPGLGTDGTWDGATYLHHRAPSAAPHPVLPHHTPSIWNSSEHSWSRAQITSAPLKTPHCTFYLWTFPASS